MIIEYEDGLKSHHYDPSKNIIRISLYMRELKQMPDYDTLELFTPVSLRDDHMCTLTRSRNIQRLIAFFIGNDK